MEKAGRVGGLWLSRLEGWNVRNDSATADF
jgi:hypothetical protein